MEKLKKMSKIRTFMTIASMMSMDADMCEYADMPKVKYTRGTYLKVRDSKTDPKINRNELCVCGSGKKYKKCYMLVNEDK